MMMCWRSSMICGGAVDVVSSTNNNHLSPSSSASSACLLNMLDLPGPNNNTPACTTAPHNTSSSSPTSNIIISLIRSLLVRIPYHWVSRPRHGKVTGTLFGHRNGHVTLAVQDHPRSLKPLILIELPTSTSDLVKEMSSGLNLRIALECHKSNTNLHKEPVWTMYCNGRKCTSGYATSRTTSDFDLHLLNTVQNVSAGAGVIPLLNPPPNSAPASHSDELLFMRARFHRVVATPNSEAFYMLNPDHNGGPDLRIFLIRL